MVYLIASVAFSFIAYSVVFNTENMTITIVDNADLLLEIWTSDPSVLPNLKNQNVFTKVHVLNDNLWLVRCEFPSLNVIHAALANVEFKILVVRFTAGTGYFSSDPNDTAAGHSIIG